MRSNWTRWTDIAVRVAVLVFAPYVLGVSGLTAVPPSSSGLHNENRLLATARAFTVPATVLAAQSGDTGVIRVSPEDTYLNLDQASYAQKSTLRIYTWPDRQAGNVAVLKFDLSSVPRDAIVQRATLRLSLIGADPTSDATYRVSAQKILRKNVVVARATGLTSDGTTMWTPSNCCFNGFPLGESDLASPEDVRAVDKTLGFKSWTVTQMVREWLASPSSNQGVMLNADATKSIDRYRDFASMEHSDASVRPYLEIQFSSADASAPSVTVTAPVAGATISDAVTLSANASDQGGVAGVRFQLNGASIGAELTAAPYTTTLDTTVLSDGNFVLTAVARDWSGNVGTSPGVSITVRNGLLFLPPQDTYLTLDTVNHSNDPVLWTYTWPNNKVANAILMKFDLSALPAGALLQEATLHLALVDSDTSTNPTYTVTAHKVVGRNPVIANATGYTSDGVTSWTASGCCQNGIPLAQSDISSPYDQRDIDKAPGRKVWTITRMVQEWLAAPASNFGLVLNSDATKLADRFRNFASMQHTDATLRPYLRLRFVAPPPVDSATDLPPVSGNIDTTPPSVAITAPASGATVSGTINVNATASDNVRVALVQFQLDGVDLGAADTAAPYSFSWNTATASNGSHVLRAVARDVAGNNKISSTVTVITSNAGAPPPSPTSGIAARYPGDVGIESDSQVVFVERFDESTLATLFGRWTDILNGSAMSFSTDVPPGSPVRNSLNISWSSSTVGGHLYKQLTPGVDDTLYVRYYVKFPAGSYSHNGVWIGGYNPALNWPNPQAGVKPTGTDRFSAAAEQNPASLRFDHYDYWMGMHQSLDGNYWGNSLLNSATVLGKASQWMCVEHMVKLNNPVTASNGEHAIWLNGVKVSHLGQGFPNGTWSGGAFTQNQSGTPFSGFRWRSDSRLNLNYIWLQTYAPGPSVSQSNMNFAHVVVAKNYIGCLTSRNTDTTPPTVSVTAPSTGSKISGSVTITANATDNVGVAGVQFKVDGVNVGNEVTTSSRSMAWNTMSSTDGTHTVTAVARDAAGNTQTSASVAVTVANQVTAPPVTAPSSTNEVPGLSVLTDQPWNAIASLGWSYMRRTSSKNDSIISDSAAPFSPSNILQIVFTPDMRQDTEPSVHWLAVPKRKEVYTSWWMKLSPNWTCSPAGCGKVTFLFNEQGQGQVYTGVYHSDTSSGPPYRIAANTEWAPYGQNVWYPNVTTTPINPGEWHRLEFYYKWETIPGVSGDGIIRFWVDGVLNGNHTTVHYPASSFIEFQYAPTLQNPPSAEQYMYIDHTRISTR